MDEHGRGSRGGAFAEDLTSQGSDRRPLWTLRLALVRCSAIFRKSRIVQTAAIVIVSVLWIWFFTELQAPLG